MAEEQWTYDDVFPEKDAEPQPAPEQESETDLEARLARLEERERKLAQKEKLEDEARRVDEEIKRFYATASEQEKELAQIFLEGAEHLTQVERAVKLIKTKAGVKAEEEQAETAEAFQPPMPAGPALQKTRLEVLRERALKGDRDAKFELFMSSESRQGNPDEAKDIKELFGIGV